VLFDGATNTKLPVCPHAGGVGLCEYVQHFGHDRLLSASPARARGAVIEYIVDHLHELSIALRIMNCLN